jgi:hypothetical protein
VVIVVPVGLPALHVATDAIDCLRTNDRRQMTVAGRTWLQLEALFGGPRGEDKSP